MSLLCAVNAGEISFEFDYFADQTVRETIRIFVKENAPKQYVDSPSKAAKLISDLAEKLSCTIEVPCTMTALFSNPNGKWRAHDTIGVDVHFGSVKEGSSKFNTLAVLKFVYSTIISREARKEDHTEFLALLKGVIRVRDNQRRRRLSPAKRLIGEIHHRILAH